jgi:hypothetical protein
MSLGGRPCALGKKREIVPAIPMSPNRRIIGYFKNTGNMETPRQLRRRKHKLGHLATLERRNGVRNVTVSEKS